VNERREPAGAVRVKICGVTRVEDARRAAALGADFLGLNFYGGSPRCVTAEAARAIADAVRGQVRLVGVFVNEPPHRVEKIAEQVGLDLLQFHGDEGAADLAPFGERAIKVIRCAGRPDAAELASFAAVWGFLLERRNPRLYGGAGEEWDFRQAADPPTAKPVLLAGGLGPDNLRRALREARPWGIDVCSRVESAPGVKDPRLLERLFREAHDAQAPAAR
jgi:phosphoribosylanthranilate isomerase